MDLFNKKKLKRLEIEIDDVKKHNQVLQDRITYLKQEIAIFEQNRDVLEPTPTLDAKSLAKSIREKSSVKNFGCARYWMIPIKVLDEIIDSCVYLSTIKEISLNTLAATITIVTNIEILVDSTLTINDHLYFTSSCEKIEDKTICTIHPFVNKLEDLIKIKDIKVGDKVYIR
jgi:hypothetical protein